MIVSLGFGNTDGDTPSVFVIDTEKCTEEWRNAILRQIRDCAHQYDCPKEWQSLERAKVNLPAMVDAAVFIYYDG